MSRSRRDHSLGLSDDNASQSVGMGYDNAPSYPGRRGDGGRNRLPEPHKDYRLSRKELPPIPVDEGSSGTRSQSMNERHRDNHHSHRGINHQRCSEGSSAKLSSSRGPKTLIKRIKKASSREFDHGTDDSGCYETADQKTTHMQEIERLRQQLANANSSIEELRAKVTAKEETGAQLKRRNNAIQSSRDRQDELFGQQEQDSNISAEFNEIFIQLKSWTSRFCNSAQSPAPIQVATGQNFELICRVLPSLADFKDLPRLLHPNDLRRRRKFIQGWVSLILAEFIICPEPKAGQVSSPQQNLWLPPTTRNSVHELQTTLLTSSKGVTHPSVHRWRAITMVMLNNIYTSIEWPQDTRDFIDKQLDFTLSVILPLSSQPDNIAEHRQKLRDNIFFPALTFSRLLRRQCAYWSVVFPPLAASNLFDPFTMVDPEDDGEDAAVEGFPRSVEIVMTPILFKRGNQDGLQYDIMGTVQKAEVSCAEVRAGELNRKPTI